MVYNAYESSFVLFLFIALKAFLLKFDSDAFGTSVLLPFVCLILILLAENCV